MAIQYVVLFDIDGTLVSSEVSENGERQRYVDTIREIVGREPDVVPARFAGMVDPQICRILLTEVGLSEEKIRIFLPKVITRMSEVYLEMKKKVALNSGVSELLPLLTQSPKHVIGVLTGNLSPIAREKL